VKKIFLMIFNLTEIQSFTLLFWNLKFRENFCDNISNLLYNFWNLFSIQDENKLRIRILKMDAVQNHRCINPLNPVSFASSFSFAVFTTSFGSRISIFKAIKLKKWLVNLSLRITSKSKFAGLSPKMSNKKSHILLNIPRCTRSYVANASI
jgi:hypothetical protein